MKHIILLLSLTLATPALAGVEEALDRHILPGFQAFAERAETLAETARADCSPGAVRPAYQAAFDAWTAVGDIRLGPSESGALPIAFWPDDRGFTPRTLGRLVVEQDPIAANPAAYREVSIAARGLFALEMLIYDPAFADYSPDSYACTLVQTVAADLSAQARALDMGWTTTFAGILKSAGDPGNATYLSGDEAVRALYTQILTGLEFTADTRLGRPLGTFDRPRPQRAEAWRSGRSLKNVTGSVAAAVELAHALAHWDLPGTDAAAERVSRAARALDGDPALQSADDPQGRLKIEILQQAVRGLKAAVEAEIGTPLGIAPGFNSQDGD